MKDEEKSTVITMEDGKKSTVYHGGWRKEYSLSSRMEKKVQFTTKDREKSTVYHEGWRKEYS